MHSDEPHVDEMSLSAVMAALSDPMRVAIVRRLAAEGERTCGTFDLGISKATRSHHFRVLREAGITHTRAEGTHRHVSLRREDVDARFPGLLGAVLAAAEREARGRIREAILQTTEAAAQPFARIV
jgi:DNA-binding transcriptional ArsR family regulator